MRVIAGSARSLALKTVEGLDTRPTTDRIKETLFNMIAFDIPGCRFLDLFSGSGAIGIEALSRGATEAVFVEQGSKQVDVIRENLAFTKLADRGIVMHTDAVTAIHRLAGKGSFDLIFMDPPYDQGLEAIALQALRETDLCTEDTIIIFEASLSTDLDFVEELGFVPYKVKKYKTNMHVFCRKDA
ncbi:MAG: 16S rRNA (guanine(966)-N(2))-methyltransferase RsmD [Lachnospiraceae bacterium]|nr:16S rRNA (guanine(966)-N(2))-methyltransferase RsmD [Lachnospiraceae bacterium]